MVKQLITDISEEDFRKLDVKISRNEKYVSKSPVTGRDVIEWKMTEVSANDVLDIEIDYILNGGHASDMELLEVPVTLAIHEPGGYYLDKFMNRFTGAQTYQLGFGIKHLYSTRDYYECRDGDYWKIRKDETKVIYRIKLDPKWLQLFEVKNKTEIIDWPYDKLPEGVEPGFVEAKLAIGYYKAEDGSWCESCRTGRFKYSFGRMDIVAVNEDGSRKKPEWEKPDVRSDN